MELIQIVTGYFFNCTIYFLRWSSQKLKDNNVLDQEIELFHDIENLTMFSIKKKNWHDLNT